ncbi:MAG: hypothetical protein AVDCRST_MAG64-2586, partial [uncultured Phycisphaerae bacterium]
AAIAFDRPPPKLCRRDGPPLARPAPRASTRADAAAERRDVRRRLPLRPAAGRRGRPPGGLRR